MSCCCKEKTQDCNCAGQEIEVLGKTARADIQFDQIAELLSTGKETFAMYENHKLTESALAMWNLHKEVIDATLDGGWDNQVQRDAGLLAIRPGVLRLRHAFYGYD